MSKYCWIDRVLDRLGLARRSRLYRWICDGQTAGWMLGEMRAERDAWRELCGQWITAHRSLCESIYIDESELTAECGGGLPEKPEGM